MKHNLKSVLRTGSRVLLCAAFLFSAQPAAAQFGNLLGKAKKAVEDKGKKAVDDGKKKATEKVTTMAVDEVLKKILGGDRPERPWTMDPEDKTDVDKYIMGLGAADAAEVKKLKEQMDARFLTNQKIIAAQDVEEYAGVLYDIIQKAKEEQDCWESFYGNMFSDLCFHVQGVKWDPEKDVKFSEYFMMLVVARSGGGNGYLIERTDNGGRFTDRSGNGAFLEEDALQDAKDALERIKQWEVLSYHVKNMIEETGFKPRMDDIRIIYNMCRIYTIPLEKAITANSPENITRQPMPKAGKLHASLKAKALAVAKEADKDVVDVVIISDDWDVKYKGIVPDRRNIYGYYVIQDKYGRKCAPRTWCERYNGGGYGALQPGGIGVGAVFYVK